MIYGSVCSGIEAASVAWRTLGWKCAFVSEIAPFPNAVLSHHYPEVPNFGDFTQIQRKQGPRAEPIHVLVGGTPCQSFSVAGLRKGMEDPRGNLALEYLSLIDRLTPKWIVWENVPGVLSSNKGRDFGTFIGALGQLGYGWAYRVLDAQYFGVAQRRRRVFVVGYRGDWRRAAAVLFERYGLQGNPAPRREKGKEVAGTLGGSSQTGGFRTTDLDNIGALVFPSEMSATQRGISTELSPALSVKYTMAVMTLAIRGRGDGRDLETREDGTSNAILTPNGGRDGIGVGAVMYKSTIRRLTPRECERLQGFPDDYTRIPWNGRLAEKCPDGPRYKALGNSMAVPVMRWIGQRIEDIGNV